MPDDPHGRSLYTRAVLWAASELAEGASGRVVGGRMGRVFPGLSPAERQQALDVARRTPRTGPMPLRGAGARLPKPYRVPVLEGGPQNAERVKVRFDWGNDRRGRYRVREAIVDIDPTMTDAEIEDMLEGVIRNYRDTSPDWRTMPDDDPEISIVWAYQG